MTERCCRELVHWIFVYWIVLGIPSCAPSSSQVTEDNDKASRIVSDILDIWKWSFFWDQKLLFFPEDGSALDSSNYSVGKKIQPLAFWHDPIIGMCSQELDVCAVYRFFKIPFDAGVTHYDGNLVVGFWDALFAASSIF